MPFFQIVDINPAPVVIGEPARIIECDVINMIAPDYESYDDALAALTAYQRAANNFDVYAIVVTTFAFPIKARS